MKTQSLILVLAAVVFSTGCTTLKPPKLPTLTRDAEMTSASASEAEEPVYGTPVKMLAIWKDSVRTTPGKPSMRGFGGRIFLYDAADKPIRAQGELVIYGFDDSVTNREGSKADQKIVITNDQLQKRYSMSGLGDSYSVWIDWDAVGSPDKSVTLIPFFRMPDGEIVRAGQAIYTLHSGKADKLYKEKLASNEEDVDDMSQHVSQANFLQADGDSNGVVTASGMERLPEKKSKNSVRTTTIRVPSQTQQRLRDSSYIRSRSRTNAKSADSDEASVESSDVAAEKSETEVRPSRLEAAREKRRKAIGDGNVFGMPGQL